MFLADLLWTLTGLGAAAVPLAASFATTLVRRRRLQAAQAALAVSRGASEYHLSPTIEDAERGMAVLLRRLRAYLRDPYDFTMSRIAGEAAFEDCLDRAGALGSRIAELGGAAPASLAERERTRGLILEGLMISHQIAGTRTMPRSENRTSGSTIPTMPVRLTANAGGVSAKPAGSANHVAAEHGPRRVPVPHYR